MREQDNIYIQRINIFLDTIVTDITPREQCRFDWCVQVPRDWQGSDTVSVRDLPRISWRLYQWTTATFMKPLAGILPVSHKYLFTYP